MIVFANGRCSVVILSRPMFALRMGWESLSSHSFAEARLRTCTAQGGGGNSAYKRGRGGNSAYKRGKDARRLAEGCKFRFLVSLGCSGQTAISREGLV